MADPILQLTEEQRYTSSRSRDVKAETHTSAVAGEPAPRKPTVGSLAICCARAPSGHAAAAPPSSVMKARRLMSDMVFPARAADLPHASLPRSDQHAQIAERKHCRPHARPFCLGFQRKVPVFPICPPAALLGPPACAAPCSCHHEACSARSAWPHPGKACLSV